MLDGGEPAIKRRGGLGERVVAVRSDRVGFGRSPILKPVFRRRSGVHEGLKSGIETGLHEVDGAGYVRSDHLFEVRLARVSAMRRQMEDPFGPDRAHGCPDAVCVAEVGEMN